MGEYKPKLTGENKMKKEEAIAIRDQFFEESFWGYGLFEILSGKELGEFVREEMALAAHWCHLAGDVEGEISPTPQRGVEQ